MMDITLKKAHSDNTKVVFNSQKAKDLFEKSYKQKVPRGNITIKTSSKMNLVLWAISHNLTSETV